MYTNSYYPPASIISVMYTLSHLFTINIYTTPCWYSLYTDTSNRVHQGHLPVINTYSK